MEKHFLRDGWKHSQIKKNINEKGNWKTGMWSLLPGEDQEEEEDKPLMRADKCECRGNQSQREEPWRYKTHGRREEN